MKRIVFLALVIAQLSVFVPRTYNTYVGNQCGVTLDNPGGHCYGDVVAGGFPLVFIYDGCAWTSPCDSINPWLIFASAFDHIIWINFLVNSLAYFLIFYAIMRLYKVRKDQCLTSEVKHW